MKLTHSKPTFHLLIFFVLLASLLGGTVVVTPVHAATVTVTNVNDSGAGSLRQAITDATIGDTIDFDPALSGSTIYLASTLTLAQDLTIDGSTLTAQISISGDTDNDGTGDVGVFSVGSGATVILNSLTITKGSTSTGAGIFNASGAALTVTNSTLSGNTATSGPGGGIRNNGTLTVTNSTFSNNSASASGGGIRNIGTLTVANSTFSGNSAIAGSGGGIYNAATFVSVTITNSTFSGNGASSQGGGIYYSGGVLNYANTIIANSTSGGDCAGDGTIGTNTNNLVEDSSCSASLSGDPNLGSLTDNGGPTQTLALLTGSTAINAGDNASCAAAPISNLDQRGVTRPQGAQCDIGSYEYPIIVVTKLDDTNDGVCDSDCSLREAIATASADNTITFNSSLSGGTIHLTSTLNIVQNLTVDGSALASKITLSGDSDSNGTGDVRVLFVHSGMTVTLDSLIITKGIGTALSNEGFTGGGGIQNNSGNTSGVVLTVKNSVISGNSADDGGGIYNRDQSTLTVINSTISGNVAATGNGGGIYSDGALTVTDSTLSGNSAAVDGGGIRDGSITTITNSTLSGNSASGSGGGIFNAGALTMRNSTLSGNSASASNGGGFYGNNTFNSTNNIMANSTSGGDCAGEIDTNTNNLVEDGSCSPALSGDPSLGTLTGSPAYFPLITGSSAIDAGDDATCAASPVSNTSQNGVTRPVGAHCDIGAYEGAVAPATATPTATETATVTFTPTATATITFTPTSTKTRTLTPTFANTATPTKTATLTSTANPSVSIVDFSFQPANLIINVGQTVTWTNNGSMSHTVTSNTAVWNSATINPGGSFNFTFTNAGTYSYHCAFHGSMTGTITVNALPTNTPTQTSTNTVTPTLTLSKTATETATPTKTITPTKTATPTSITFYSMAAHDGWILESSENSNAGGTIYSTGLALLLGDSVAKQQYRSILSFNTSSLPDNATITGITLKLKKNGFIGGNSPITVFQGIMVDIKTGFFGTFAALQAPDFQATADKTLGPATPILIGDSYYLGLINGKAFINKYAATSSGLTQIRLRFNLDDNNDAIANDLSLYSGNATLATDRPQLVITYTVP